MVQKFFIFMKLLIISHFIIKDIVYQGDILFYTTYFKVWYILNACTARF